MKMIGLPLLVCLVTVWPSHAQETQLPGCRVTSLLGEAIVGPDHLAFLVLWNPHGTPQRVETSITDAVGHTGLSVLTLAPYERWSEGVMDQSRRILPTFRAVSMLVRWEVSGSAHMTTWRVPDRPVISVNDFFAWVREWRIELVSPVQRETICIP